MTEDIVVSDAPRSPLFVKLGTFKEVIVVRGKKAAGLMCVLPAVFACASTPGAQRPFHPLTPLTGVQTRAA